MNIMRMKGRSKMMRTIKVTGKGKIAVKQLEATDLFLVAKDGVNKFIESKYKRDELFEKAKVYLTTPVRDRKSVV